MMPSCDQTARARAAPPARRRYFTSVSILNIGRYMLMMITPTMHADADHHQRLDDRGEGRIDASTSSS